MRELVLKISMSIDGFVGGPNGEVDWLFGSLDPESTSWIIDTLAGAAVHVMGRRTYQDMAAHWPVSSEPYAKPMNEIPKAVFSRSGGVRPDRSQATKSLQDAEHRLTHEQRSASPEASPSWPSWVGAQVFSDLRAGIAQLKQGTGGYVLAHGGAGFVQSLVAHDLIDEYHLLVHPVAVGSGLPIFSMIPEARHFRLERSISFPKGIVGNVYRPSQLS